MQRNKKDVFKKEEKVDSVYSELPNVLSGEHAETLSVYTDNDGNRAVVLPGWTVSGVPKENTIWGKDKGLCIYHIPEREVSGIDWKDDDRVNTLMETYDQLVCMPVNMLSATSTLDGIHFNEKFGRMNYRNEKFSKYRERVEGDLALQKESIEKYGICYITRYKISQDVRTGKLKSVKNAIALNRLSIEEAIYTAKHIARTETYTSHLTYGAEYDTRSKWAIETGTVTIDEIAKDSTMLGNYPGNENYADMEMKSGCMNQIVETGKDGCVNNIYGFAGNTAEWTQEHGEIGNVIRGGGMYSGISCPVDYRGVCNKFGHGYDWRRAPRTGCRATICIN